MARPILKVLLVGSWDFDCLSFFLCVGFRV